MWKDKDFALAASQCLSCCLIAPELNTPHTHTHTSTHFHHSVALLRLSAAFISNWKRMRLFVTCCHGNQDKRCSLSAVSPGMEQLLPTLTLRWTQSHTYIYSTSQSHYRKHIFITLKFHLPLLHILEIVIRTREWGHVSLRLPECLPDLLWSLYGVTFTIQTLHTDYKLSQKCRRKK